MNSDQITSIIRQIFLAIGGFAVGKGWFDNDTLVQLAGAASVIVGSIWALWTRTNKNIVASAAAKVSVSETSQAQAGITKPVSPS